jgi:tRNA threonylcarbamoyladenosine biosynthesis protein TsaE
MQMQVSLDKVEEFVNAFWKEAKDVKVFAWHGQMGAGKTTLITALGRSKGVQDAMSSPTFSLINQYAYKENGEEKVMYHIDLYRLKDEQEALHAGVEDAIYSGAICMVEWLEKAPHLFDENTIHVFVDVVSDTERLVRMELPNSRNL